MAWARSARSPSNAGDILGSTAGIAPGRATVSALNVRSSSAPRASITVAAIAAHFVEHELGDQSLSVRPLSHTTVSAYKRCISLRILPRWGRELATAVKPLAIEQWLKALKQTSKLSNATLAKTRNVLSLIYRHGIRHSSSLAVREATRLHWSGAARPATLSL